MTENTQDIVYDIPSYKAEARRHTLAILVDNEFGVLARVVGLFSGRGYNIESLTVAEVEHDKKLSRITIVTSGTEAVVEQIRKLLEKMVPVHRVHDLTLEGAYVERELALVKVIGEEDLHPQILRLADIFQARVVDFSAEFFIFELSGTSSRIDAFIGQLRPMGVIDVCRTGVVAASKGSDGI